MTRGSVMTGPRLAAVAGIDISLTATGLAVITQWQPAPGPWTDPAEATTLTTFPSAGKRGDTLAQRGDRLRRILDSLFENYTSPDLAVIEAPAVTRQGGSSWDRAGLWWMTVDWLQRAGVPVAAVVPQHAKQFAAGKGNADKAAVAVGMARMWTNITGADDNQWDALSLAHMGARQLGFNVPTRAHHAAVLAKVAWPETKEAVA